jgi:hypothetical protein
MMMRATGRSPFRIVNKTNLASNGDGTPHKSWSQHAHSARSRNPRQKLERFNRDLANLLASDFTRDLVIILETVSTEPTERFQWVSLRNKIDTYSDENFISHKILDKYDMKQGKIRTIPEAEQRERELTMLGGYKLKPQRAITLEWYRPKDTQKRETTFIIAENNPPFDTLICKKDWDSEIPQSAFPIFGRRKTKGKLENETRYTYQLPLQVQLTFEKPSGKQRPKRNRSRNRLRGGWSGSSSRRSRT